MITESGTIIRNNNSPANAIITLIKPRLINFKDTIFEGHYSWVVYADGGYIKSENSIYRDNHAYSFYIYNAFTELKNITLSNTKAY